MSMMAQVIIYLLNLRKMLLEDMAWEVITVLNIRASVSQARARAAEAEGSRNPLRFSLFINCSMRLGHELKKSATKQDKCT